MDEKGASSNTNTKNEACGSRNGEGRPGRNTEILPEHAEMQFRK